MREWISHHIAVSSRRDYTIHQHLTSYCLKELQGQSYREYKNLSEGFGELREALELDKVPHYTILNKSLKRLPPKWLRFLLKRLVELIGSKYRGTVDGTGIKLTTASYSYIKRIGKKIRKRDCFKVINEVSKALEKGLRTKKEENPRTPASNSASGIIYRVKMYISDEDILIFECSL